MNKTLQNILAIIPAAGKPTNKIMVDSNLPDTMLPINGKPVIAYIIEDLLKRGIVRTIIILNKDDTHTEKYVSKKFKSKCELIVIYNDNYNKGIGHSIYLAKPHIKKTDGIFIYLGDTIYKGTLSFNEDFLVVSNKYESTEKWCFVEQNKESKNKLSFIDKPKEYSGKNKILCGLYFFKNSLDFAKIITTQENKKDRIEMSDILNSYAKNHKFKLIDAKKWYDCGNIENFYKAKIDFLKVRSFNSMSYDDLRGEITKSSRNKEKIIQEINWFKNIPDNLRIFTPRLIRHEINDKYASYTMEFYSYQSLADFFILGSLHPKLWHIIIDKILNIIKLFKSHHTVLSYSHYEDVYFKKTMSRLEKMSSDPSWKNLLEQENITINGVVHKNLPNFKNLIENAVKKLHVKTEMNFIHGDLCLSNILFDPSSKIFKLIDPRGSFGEKSIYGDTKYDLAKLRHSFSGSYDFIVSDLFDLKETIPFTFTYTNHAEDYHAEISRHFDTQVSKRGYNLEKIKLIEALLFLSMIPLHSDNPLRQKAMYLTGIRLLNESKVISLK